MNDRRAAPFTLAEVATLNEFQNSDVWEAVTCPNPECGRELVATEAGWTCPACSFTQNWAFAWMTDGSWRDDGTISNRDG
jgi:hypothetical protein